MITYIRNRLADQRRQSAAFDIASRDRRAGMSIIVALELARSWLWAMETIETSEEVPNR